MAELGDDPVDLRVRMGFKSKALVLGALKMHVELVEGLLAALAVPLLPPGHRAGGRPRAWLSGPGMV